VAFNFNFSDFNISDFDDDGFKIAKSRELISAFCVLAFQSLALGFRFSVLAFAFGFQFLIC
jgi:hypothetical protein